LEQLDDDVDACCSQYGDTASAAELEQQLSKFEQVRRVGGLLEVKLSMPKTKPVSGLSQLCLSLFVWLDLAVSRVAAA
jgi:hypothetical protein